MIPASLLLRFAWASGVLWGAVRPGVWRHEATMAAEGPLAVVRATAIRVDPAVHRFVLHKATADFGLRGTWTIDSMSAEGVLAVNTGHFTGGFPWGWVVRDGVEEQPPGTGSVTMAFVVDAGGRASLVAPAAIGAMRGSARQAFQSYPALLVDGAMPWELQGAGRGVDLDHRDSRVALCSLADGTVVVAITRFHGLAGVASTLPWGPTTPEMASYMQSLGCRQAMLLDGGMSSQMTAREADGSLARWPNWRAVPMGLVVLPEGGARCAGGQMAACGRGGSVPQ